MHADHANPILLARCTRGRRISFEAFSRTCQAFMRDLTALHPGFAGLNFVRAGDPQRQAALLPDLSNLDEGLRQHGWRANAKYTEKDEHGRPTPQSIGDYQLSLSNWTDFDHKFDVSVTTSPTTYLPTNCVVDLPGPDYPEFLTLALSQALLGAVLKHWPVRYASYAQRGWNQGFNRSGPQEDWTGCIEIGWHTYVDEPRVADVLPSDVTVQRVGSGILFTLFDHMPDVNNPATVERAREVRARLAEAGLLKPNLT